MGFSKKSKRGMAILNHLQTQNWRYHVPAPTRILFDPNTLDASVLQAGADAIAKMRENANAIQKLSNSEGDAEPAGAETRTDDGVHIQQKDGQEGAESTDDSASGGAR